MRAFALFFALMIAALAAIAVFSYPVWVLLHPHFNFPFHRMGERIGMLALAIGFVLVARRAKLSDKRSLGYGPRFDPCCEPCGPFAIRPRFRGLARQPYRLRLHGRQRLPL
jgi:hypothetical protein